MISLIHTILTWLELTALAFCIAVLVFRLPVFLPPTPVAGYGYEIFTSRIWRLFGFAAAVIVLAGIGDLLLRAAEMSARPLQNVFPALAPVLFRTHYGAVWLVRIAALVLLSLLSQAGGNYRDSNVIRYIMLALGVIIAWTESASGHASDLGDFSIREMADLFHLLAASAWGGGLLVLSLVILPPLVKRGDMITMAEISRRFSFMAGYAVVIIVLTAVYNARTYVGDFSALWKAPYGLTVVAKMVLLYFLILLGGFNRYVSVPLLQHVAGSRIEGPGLIAHIAGTAFDRVRGYISGHIAMLFGKIVLIEATLMVLIFLCAAGLKHETPASHLKHLEHEQMQQATHRTFDRIMEPRVPTLDKNIRGQARDTQINTR